MQAPLATHREQKEIQNRLPTMLYVFEHET